jgi:hypothetical protein
MYRLHFPVNGSQIEWIIVFALAADTLFMLTTTYPRRMHLWDLQLVLQRDKFVRQLITQRDKYIHHTMGLQLLPLILKVIPLIRRQ